MAGHDEKRIYIITKIIDENFVMLCDGKYHKLENLKRKRIKHLKLKNDVSEKLNTNSEIREAIKKYEKKTKGA